MNDTFSSKFLDLHNLIWGVWCNWQHIKGCPEKDTYSNYLNPLLMESSRFESWCAPF